MKILVFAVLSIFSIQMFGQSRARHSENAERRSADELAGLVSQAIANNEVLEEKLLGQTMRNVLRQLGLSKEQYEAYPYSYGIWMERSENGEIRGMHADAVFIYFTEEQKVLHLFFDFYQRVIYEEVLDPEKPWLDLTCMGIEYADLDRKQYEFIGNLSYTVWERENGTKVVFSTFNPLLDFEKLED